MNRWLPVTLVGLAGAVIIGCTGQTPSMPSASPSPSTSTAPSVAPSAAPSTAPSASPSASAGPVSFKTQVVPILKQHCATCHTAGGGGAREIEMFTSAGEAEHANIQPEIEDMIQAIRSGKMPMGKPGSVPEDQIKTLESWQGAGAPNN